MDELLKIQGCNDSDRFTSLRYVYDKMTVHVRGLASLGVDSEQYGSLLIPIVMAKLPSELRLRIARVAKGSVWKIDELLDVIRQEVEAKEISERVMATDQKPSTYHRNRPSTASALFSKAEPNDKGSSVIKCVYCEAPHYSASCAKVTDTKLRRNILFESKRCFKCLKPGHQVKDCRKPNGCRSCGGHHHQSICSNASIGSKRETNAEESNKQERDNEEKPATRTTCAKTKENVLLQTATATALNEDGSKSTTVRILFDTGSQRSYITDNLKTRLGLKTTKTKTLQLNTFGEKGYRKQRCNVAAVRLKTNARELLEISALSYPVICSPLPGKVNVKEYSHLHGLQLADSSIENQPIDVLIGSDYHWEFIEGETVRGHAGPTAINSKFGWLLSGPVRKTTNCTSSKVVSNLVVSGFNAVPHDIVPKNDEMLNYTLKQFWETEAIGIKESTIDINPSITPEFTKPKISHNGRYYEASLPWKDDCMPTSNNYGLCVSRLRYLYYNLKKKPALLKEYDGIIQEQCKAGIIERVPNEVSKETVVKGVHFSPHHAVVRTSRETTKVRVVYDGSAKSTKDDRSLNDCLHNGPNYIPLVFDMLIKFRLNAVALTADIEKAFLMVGIKKKHRDMLRFLWFANPNEATPEIVQYRFNRLVFGLRPSPSILGATIKHHLELYKRSEPELVELIEKSLYVDDLVSGELNEEKAYEIYEKSKKIMSEGGFNLRKWHTNYKFA